NGGAMAAQLTWRERFEQSSVIPTDHVPVRCDVFELAIPLRAPIAASTVPTFDVVHHLVVVLRADGLTGWGYSAHRLHDGVHQAAAEVTRMLGGLDMELGALLRFELDWLHARRERASWPIRLATNAIGLAAWDLAARRAGLSCAAAWGAPDVAEID